MYDFMDSNVLADVLALIGATASAGIVMTKFRSCILMGLVPEGLTHCDLGMRYDIISHVKH